MKKHVVVVTAAALAAAASSALASEELAKKHACTACHAIDKKVVGPAYKEVAAKYRGDAKAQAAMAKSVKEGSVGKWGQVPMPPNAGVPDGDVQALVKWILSLK